MMKKFIYLFLAVTLFSCNDDDSEGTHMRIYTVSEDGNTLVFEDENCILPQIQFTRTEVEFNPCN